MLKGVSALVAIAAGVAGVGTAIAAAARWWVTRGAVLHADVERTPGGHRLLISNTGRGSAFGLHATVRVRVHGKAFDPVGAAAGGSPFPLNELPVGQEFHAPLILLEAADPQLEVVLSWTEGPRRRHRREVFRPSYSW